MVGPCAKKYQVLSRRLGRPAVARARVAHLPFSRQRSQTVGEKSQCVNTAETFDYVLVGAGSAGCVLANRLTAAGYSVLLLEAGPRDSNFWLHLPVGYYKTSHDKRWNWSFETQPEPHLNGRRIRWPRGRVLGGSSAINGLLHLRGQPADFDAWAAEGCEGWSYDQVLPYFKKSESQENGDPTRHGKAGPLPVSTANVKLPIIDKFLQACSEVGMRRGEDLNGLHPQGAGISQTTTRNGWRVSSATAHLTPATRRRPHLTIRTNATARRILFDKADDGSPRSIGVHYQDGVSCSRARAKKEVIVTSGAVGSPHLLLLSGIGPASQLRKHGIEVWQDLPGVGKNLQDHLQIRSLYRCSIPTINDAVRSPAGLLRMLWQWISSGSGPLTMGPTPAVAFGHTYRSDGHIPDVQIHFGPWTAKTRRMGFFGLSPFRVLDPYSAFTMTVCQLRPHSRGSISLQSDDPLDKPSIEAAYLSDSRDAEAALAGLRLTRAVARAPALSQIITAEDAPSKALDSDKQLIEYIKSTAESIYHPVGTCKMGRATDDLAVVDPRLRVHGVHGLRVCDASIMPTIVSANTNASTMMIAEKAADMILGDADLSKHY